MLRKFKISAVLAVYFFLSNPLHSESEKNYILEIEKAQQKNDSEAVLAKTAEFYKKFPSSREIMRIRVIEADHTSSSGEALGKYRSIEKSASDLSIKEYCRFKICTVYYLQSSWDMLRQESESGIRLYKSGRYYYDFHFFLAKSFFHKQLFSDAYEICGICIEKGAEFYFYPEAQILYNYLEQKLKGNSSSYAQKLSSGSIQFAETGIEISSLFLLGRQYEYQKNYSYAFSVYTDIIKNFPKSPEAEYAAERIKEISGFSPKYESNYLKNSSSSSDFLNLSPEDDVKTVENTNFYAIELGPFYNLKNVENIKRLIDNSFKHVFIVRKKTFFSIYVEQTSDPEDALKIRIRLAEEFGLNGNIIFVKNDNGVQYYYGD